MRITMAITQSPIVSTLKLVGDTAVIESDGQIHCHGLARSEKSLPYDISSAVGVGSTKPLDQDLFYSTQLNLGRVGNRFKSGDESGLVFNVPYDFDSSSPTRFRFTYSSNSNTALQNPFSMTIYWACVSVGSVVYATQPIGVTHPNERSLTFELPVNQADGRSLLIRSVELETPECRSSNENGLITDIVVYKIRRNADANANDLVMSNFQPYYISWRESGINRI